jgi:hypothetical protein
MPYARYWILAVLPGNVFPHSGKRARAASPGVRHAKAVEVSWGCGFSLPQFNADAEGALGCGRSFYQVVGDILSRHLTAPADESALGKGHRLQNDCMWGHMEALCADGMRSFLCSEAGWADRLTSIRAGGSVVIREVVARWGGRPTPTLRDS